MRPVDPWIVEHPIKEIFFSILERFGGIYFDEKHKAAEVW